MSTHQAEASSGMPPSQDPPARLRRLAPGHHFFETLAVGDWYETPAVIVTTQHIDAFAALTGDRFAIHISDEAGRELGFPARVAHGLLVLSLLDGLKNQSPVLLRAVASLGWHWRFHAPVLVDDILAAEIYIAGKRETRNPARGILDLHLEARNQHGKLVQSGLNQLMVLREPEP